MPRASAWRDGLIWAWLGALQGLDAVDVNQRAMHRSVGLRVTDDDASPKNHDVLLMAHLVFFAVRQANLERLKGGSVQPFLNRLGVHISAGKTKLRPLKWLDFGDVCQRAQREGVVFGKADEQIALEYHRVFWVADLMDFTARQMNLEWDERLYPQHGLNGFGVHIPKSTRTDNE
ncbi:MAG TPA: hypothetical protein VJ783_24450 [Pirellulales bacterium]|nr:hypothetical protein [Pirellulales bacterium]